MKMMNKLYSAAVSAGAKSTQLKKLALVLLLGVLVATASFSQAAIIQWNTSFADAQAQARSSGRSMFLFFEGQTPNAITLSLLQNTFPNSDIATVINEQFVPVRIRSNPQLETSFGVIRYPTIVIADSDGQRMLSSLSGIMSTENVMSLLLRTSSNASSASSYSTTAYQPPVQDTRTDVALGAVRQVATAGLVGNVYTYSDGTFTKLDGDRWVHKTAFYTVYYRMIADGQFFYYLENDKRDVFVAVPKNAGDSLWVWENNVWKRVSSSPPASADKNVIIVPSQY